MLLKDSKAMTLHKCHHTTHYFSKLPLMHYLKGNTIQVLPSDIGEYLRSFFNAIVVVVFSSIFIL